MKRKWLWLAPLAVGVSISAVAQVPVPYEHRYYDDGYQVFVGNGNLPRAREVVENALYWRPADAVWLQRLAQVAAAATGGASAHGRVASAAGDSE